MVFWKIGTLVFLKRISITLGLGEVFGECLWKSLFLVKLQACILLLDSEMSSFGGVIKDFTQILGFHLLIFFHNTSPFHDTSHTSGCCHCLVLLPLCFYNYEIIVVNITKLYNSLLCFLMKKNSNEKKKLYEVSLNNSMIKTGSQKRSSGGIL